MRHLSGFDRPKLALLALTGVFALLAAEYTFQFSHSLRHVLNVAVYNNVMIAAGVLCVLRGVLHRRERDWPSCERISSTSAAYAGG